jgi:hypothetical protein
MRELYVDQFEVLEDFGKVVSERFDDISAQYLVTV